MRGWGKQAPVEARFPQGLPKGLDGVGWNADQPRRADRSARLAEVPDGVGLNARRQAAPLDRQACSGACQQLLGFLRKQLAIVHHRHDLDAAVRHLIDQAIRSLQHFS